MEKWRILVVDDESDVHAVTALALKRRSWRGRGFELVNGFSRAEAERLLKDPRHFDVCLVDVVMETDNAGLELCQHIRDTQPRWTRIILRTGQSGRAPEAEVSRDFDIDYYLAKADLEDFRLYQTVCSSLRSSEDCAMLTAVTEQLGGYVKVIQEDDRPEQLVQSFAGTLKFLETKYGIGAAVFGDVTKGGAVEVLGGSFAALAKERAPAVPDVLRSIQGDDVRRSADYAPCLLNPTTAAFRFRLAPKSAAPKTRVSLTEKFSSLIGADRTWEPSATVVIKFSDGLPPKAIDKVLRDVRYDLRLFGNSWQLAYELLCTQRVLGTAMSSGAW